MRSRTAAVGEEAAPGPRRAMHAAAATVDPRLLRIEQKLDCMARQMSGLPTSDGTRATMAVVAVGAGLVGGVLIHP